MAFVSLLRKNIENYCGPMPWLCHDGGQWSAKAEPLPGSLQFSFDEHEPLFGDILARCEKQELADVFLNDAQRQLASTLNVDVWQAYAYFGAQKKLFLARVLEWCSPRSSCVAYQNVFEKQNDLLAKFTAVQFELPPGCPKVLTDALGVDANGVSPAPVYNRFGTRTGRLTVDSGAPMLTMARGSRKFIKPHNSENLLAYLDFSSLEPRIMLAENGIPANQDPYEFAKKYLPGSTREEAKLKTVAAIYSKEYSPALDPLTFKIRQRFGVTKIFKMATSADVLLNKFCRPIPRPEPSVAVSHYVQSTGADLALLAFSEIVEADDQVRPVGVIHDALIVEIPKSYYATFEQKNASWYCAAYDTHFPMSLSLL